MNALEIISAVTERTGVPVEEMRMRSRRSDRVYARHLAMYFIANSTRMHDACIANLFGYHRTTVINARDRIRREMDIYTYVERDVVAIAERLQITA